VVVADYVEPKARHPALAHHTLDLINLMTREKIKFDLVEPYFDLKTPNSIAEK